jgi:DNA polymerase-3 subunit epsilon
MDAADTLAFVDLETTGGNAAYDRITEIGIVRVEKGELVEEWSSLVNPDCPISPYIEAFTGISSEMVAAAPRFAELADTVLEKLHGAVFIAHNARFDHAFLRNEFRKAGVTYSPQALCTVKLSRRLFPEHARHNLDSVMERHGLSCSARHRALGDARVLHELWQKLRREIPHADFAAAAEQSMLIAPKLPEHLPPGLADELPETPGVFRYYGDGDALLFVGRANSLRAKVLSQLSATGEGARAALTAQVRRVDWMQTAGELGAMLLESRWIKTLKPANNRNPKSNTQPVTLMLPPASGSVQIQRIDELESEHLAHCFGVFHSDKDARKALTDIGRAQQLCLKVLGLEQGAGSCFAMQMGKCRGACVGKEAPILHAMRVQLALSALKIKSWPFPGRIALREKTEYHVLDQWMYVGSARCEDDLAILSAPEAAGGFDADVYRILLRYFGNHSNLDWHDLRSSNTADVH